MDNHHEQQVRRRAYEIWEAEGRPEGAGARHWQQAEEEIAAIEKGWPGATAASAAPADREALLAGEAPAEPAPKPGKARLQSSGPTAPTPELARRPGRARG